MRASVTVVRDPRIQVYRVWTPVLRNRPGTSLGTEREMPNQKVADQFNCGIQSDEVQNIGGLFEEKQVEVEEKIVKEATETIKAETDENTCHTDFDLTKDVMSDESEHNESREVHAEEAKMFELRQYEHPERALSGMGAFAASDRVSCVSVFGLRAPVLP